MDPLLDKLFGPGTNPRERNVVIHLVTDEQGNSTPQAGTADIVSHSAPGCNNHLTIITFHKCGCPSTVPAGNRCHEHGCQGINCQNHTRFCFQCHKACCVEHAYDLVTDSGQQVTACRRCHQGIVRKRRIGGFFRVLFSPFVEHTED